MTHEIPMYRPTELAPRRTKYAVVVPVINEGQRILEQLARMRDVDQMPDVVLADGGSTDGSTEPSRLSELGVRTLLVKDDVGRLGAQLRMAFWYALEEGYQGIVTIDGNGKDGVEAIPAFVRMLDRGYDFVQGSRFIAGGVEEGTPPIRRLAIRWIHAPVISRIAGESFTDTTNGFRGHSRSYLLHPEVQPFRSVFSGYELLAYLSVRASQLGLRTAEIPVRRSYPSSGPVPTKLQPMRGNLELLRVLLGLVRGEYHPRGSRVQ